jgi:hypothetical protein
LAARRPDSDRTQGWIWLVVIAATAIALALRIYPLTRPNFLFGLIEYDDGVYFGSAVRLLDGFLPYRDFVLVQPPGITLLLTPLALLAKATGTGGAFALARVLTACVGAASVPVGGLLVRRKGLLAVTLACGILAVYPAALTGASTVLLEPWLVLFCLVGALAVFDGDRLTVDGSRLAWGGAAFGFAAAIKLWAVLPILAVLLLSRRRAWLLYLGGLIAGFVLPVLPFLIAAPGAFYRDVVLAQVTRTDVTRASGWSRLESLTGLSFASPASHGAILLTGVALGGVAIVCSLFASLRSRRPPPPIECFALGTAAAVLVAFLWPSDYYPHYGAFFAPFLALSVALPVGRLAAQAGGQRVLLAALAGAAGAGLLTVAAIELRQDSHARTFNPAAAAQRQIPAGACVLADVPALTIVSDRFVSTVPDCSPMVDPIGTDYALSRGHNGVSGAGRSAAVRAAWRSVFAHAGYIWIACPPASPGCLTNRRIPWTPALLAYFSRHFEPVRAAHPLPNLYVRRRGT